MDKRDFLFRFVPHVQRTHLRFDDEALYSTTDQLTADKITKELLKHVPSTATVMDATACIGGSAYSMARQYAKVIAVEIDAKRFQHLQYNMCILGKQNVQCIHGDAMQVCQTTTQDLIFLDPPWGGPDYKNTDKLTLALCNKPLHEVAWELISFATFLAIKVPTNFDLASFTKETHTFMELRSCVTNLRKMHLLIFQRKSSITKRKGSIPTSPARTEATLLL
jgi:16S rRNA G966 N2-methylase RsmD